MRAKHVASALHHMMSGSFSRELEVTTVLIERLGCLVGSVWGNQHLCMQRQHSTQATSTLGNTPNLNIGSYNRNPPHWFLHQGNFYRSLDYQSMRPGWGLRGTARHSPLGMYNLSKLILRLEGIEGFLQLVVWVARCLAKTSFFLFSYTRFSITKASSYV